MEALRCSAAFLAVDSAAAALVRRAPFFFPSGLSARRASSGVALRVAAARTTVAEAAGKRPPRGITKPRPISPELQALVGVKEIPRTQALKLIWAYIKENNLQDPENKKIIVCDEKLKKILGGRDRVGFLEISGLLNPHFQK
ncbi:uncharacterized protein [Typha angustifolia]|uniref:uncharacterized protein n=1 Tax=Typha angustifolia TaxID=59011 RepID=UPI003C2BB09D